MKLLAGAIATLIITEAVLKRIVIFSFWFVLGSICTTLWIDSLLLVISRPVVFSKYLFGRFRRRKEVQSAA
jgi:hypothetical protein